MYGKVLMPTAIALYDEEVSRLTPDAPDDAPFACANGAIFVCGKCRAGIVRESER
jgi:hypothetical protein